MSSGISLNVVFAALGYRHRQWIVDMSECRFDYVVLNSPSIKYRDQEKTSFTFAGLGRILEEGRPSLVITMGFSIATTKLWLRSFFKRIPYIIWSEAVQNKYRPHSFIRILQRKAVVSRAAGFIACGTKAKSYLQSLGAQEEKIDIAFSTVDTDYFRNETERLRSLSDADQRPKHLLSIGHFTKRKRTDLLLRALHRLLQKRRDVVLDLVGEGPERHSLECLVEELKLHDAVHFMGFQQKTEIPKYLARARCFLFPSEYDVWGLVLIEAMSAGVPCLSSIYAGATPDLIHEGKTGFSLDFSETDRVVDKINWLLDHPDQARMIGQAASRFIDESASIKVSAARFIHALQKTLQLRSDHRLRSGIHP